MTSNKIQVPVNMRKLGFELHIQAKNMFWVRIGLWFMKIGCLIGGFGFVNEFPMSLLDKDGNEIEVERLLK